MLLDDGVEDGAIGIFGANGTFKLNRNQKITKKTENSFHHLTNEII